MSQFGNRGGNQGGGYRGRGYSNNNRGRAGYRGGYRGYRGGYQASQGNRSGGGWRGRGGGRGGGGGGSTQSTQPRVIQPDLLDMATPYPAWRLYFPEQAYSDTSPIVKRTKVFEKYFTQWQDQYEVAELADKGFFTVDYKELSSNPIVSGELSDFTTDLRQSSDIVINCLGLAFHQVMTKQKSRSSTDDLPPIPSAGNSPILPKLICRLVNYEPITPLKNLKANYYGKYVTVKGTVVRVSNIKPLCTRMEFECTTCSTTQVVLLPDGKYVSPIKCVSGECRGRTFQPRRSADATETIDWQTIRLQEIMNDDQQESGRIPRTIDCEFTHDLVDTCVPGDMVSISGLVKVLNSDEGRGRNKDKCMFLLYLAANSVTNSKGGGGNAGSAEGEGGGGFGIEFSVKDLYAIEEVHEQPNLFRLLVGSLCPGIYGHEMVKAGLVLGLFGGSQKYANDSNRIPVRGDPHVLVVGDPGLGKSQMLQAVANVAPRSVYVCGNTTTTSGLTVTLCKEGGGQGDYALEAGALVLADQGCCCIDEFDKMGNQHQALLEAMEQQSISIAKAGIVCSLPARTSILAAANPAGGHYNKGKTVSENLKMGSALLSRFDLVFILLDKPDEVMDSMLSEHVMAIHAGKRRRLDSSFTSSIRSEAESEALAQWEAEKVLSERLKVPRGEVLDPIPPSLLRKYVCYARKYVHPKISSEAAQVIQKFYLDLRKKHQTQESTPITTRQLESLIRLTEARARLDMREEATEADARDVIDIMKYSMIDTYSDDNGMLDFTRSQHGSGMSKKGKAKKLVAVLQQVSERTSNSLFSVQEIRQIALEARIDIPDLEQFVTSMNHQGYLLKKGPRVYQLQTAGF